MLGVCSSLRVRRKLHALSASITPLALPALTGYRVFLEGERTWHVNLNDGVRFNLTPPQHDGQCRTGMGKLPRCDWMAFDSRESAGSALAPHRADERPKLEAKPN